MSRVEALEQQLIAMRAELAALREAAAAKAEDEIVQPLSGTDN